MVRSLLGYTAIFSRVQQFSLESSNHENMRGLRITRCIILLLFFNDPIQARREILVLGKLHHFCAIVWIWKMKWSYTTLKQSAIFPGALLGAS